MNRFKVGDKVVTPMNSHYRDKGYIIVAIHSQYSIHLRGAKASGSRYYISFQESELEFWHIYNSPLYKALT